MSEDRPARCIVVGVTARQPAAVLQHAARFARQFQAVLVCAHVDPGTYQVAEHADGSIEARPIDPDQPDWVASPFSTELAERLRSLAADEGVQVEFRQLAGDIAHALGRLGDVLHAEMIVVGSRRPGVRSSIQEFLGGSVAAHLAHRQHRPVVVIPLSPVPAGAELPWAGTGQ